MKITAPRIRSAYRQVRSNARFVAFDGRHQFFSRVR